MFVGDLTSTRVKTLQRRWGFKHERASVPPITEVVDVGEESLFPPDSEISGSRLRREGLLKILSFI